MELTNEQEYTVNYNIYQRLLFKFLSNIKLGSLTLIDESIQKTYGDSNHEIKAIIYVKQTQFYKQVFWNGGIGFAESYILDLWETDDLTKLLRIFALNLQQVNKIDSSIYGYALRLASNILHALRRNSLIGARKNISQHYDLANDFFSLMLDKTMMYSSAKFYTHDCTLEQASLHKLQIICEKLQLKATDHVLEIGSGWGGFAIYAAQNYNCKITTITISKEQYNYAVNKVKDLNLQDKIIILFQDYRQITGVFDKLVSIEMIEAVGHQYLHKYLSICSKLLKPDGIFLLQAITISEQRYNSAKNSVDFIKKHIFPGCCIPALGEIMRFVRSDTDFNVTSIEDLSLDYALTLAKWRENFLNNIASIMQQGFDQYFIRKWLYYLCYCEAGFYERSINDLQIVLVKPGYRDRLTV